MRERERELMEYRAKSITNYSHVGICALIISNLLFLFLTREERERETAQKWCPVFGSLFLERFCCL